MPALVACVLLLSGCVPVRPVPGPMSVAERDAYLDRQEDMAWAGALPPGAERPEITRRVVTGQEWGPLFVDCMVDAGFDVYSLDPGGYAVASDEPVSYTDALRLAEVTCQTSFVVDPRDYGLLSEAQVDYLYDYYKNTLVPCLQLAGERIVQPPNHEQFRANPWWNPYVARYYLDYGTPLPSPELLRRCPPQPPGDLVTLPEEFTVPTRE